MSDDTNAQGTPSPGPSWTPPPNAPTPPPPPQQDQQAYQGGSTPDPTGGTPQPPAAKSGPNVNLSPEIVLGVLAFVGVLLGLILKVEDKVGTGASDVDGKVKLWDTMGWTWSWMALVAAVLTILPAIRAAINLSADLTKTITAVAAGALIFWWVLFILPYIGLTTAFLATLGVAAGVGAVWVSRDTRAAES